MIVETEVRKDVTSMNFWRAIDHFVDMAMPIYLSHNWYPANEANPRDRLREAVTKTVDDMLKEENVTSSHTAHYEVSRVPEPQTGMPELRFSIVILTDVGREPWQ